MLVLNALECFLCWEHKKLRRLQLYLDGGLWPGRGWGHIFCVAYPEGKLLHYAGTV